MHSCLPKILASGTWNNIPWIITNKHTLILNPDNKHVTYIPDKIYVFSPWLPYEPIIQSIIVHEHIDFSQMNSCSYLFACLTHLESVDLSLFNTTNVTSMKAMFCDCEYLTSIQLPQIPGCMNQITDASYMFCGCDHLATLDLQNFTAQSMENITAMFSNCFQLRQIDLSQINFNSCKPNKIENLFNSCNSLTSIHMFSGPLNTSNITCVFYNCVSLNSIDCSNIYLKSDGPIDCTSIFQDCTTLKELKFFSNLSNQPIPLILWQTFSNCFNLHSLSLPNYLLDFDNRNNEQTTDNDDLIDYDSFMNCNQLTNISDVIFNIQSNSHILDLNLNDSILEYLIKTHQLLPNETLLPLFIKHQKFHLIPILLHEYISTNLLNPSAIKPSLNILTENIIQNKYKAVNPADLSLLLTVLHEYLPET